MRKFYSILLAIAMLTSMIAVFAISASAEDTPLTATAYAPADDNDWIYVVFNKKVAAPTETDDVHITLAGLGTPNSTDYYMWRFNISDKLEVVNDQVWKFSEEAWMPGSDVATYIYNPIDGYYPSYPINGCGLYIYGTIKTADGTETLKLADDDVGNARLHANWDGNHWVLAYNMEYNKIDAVTNIPVPTPPVETTANNEATVTTEANSNPETSDAAIAISVLTVISLAGVVIASRKRRV